MQGYKGPLCGGCKKSFGLSSNFECSKCGRDIVVVLRFIGALVYLLIGTIVIIKGVLPFDSSRQACEDAETPLHGHVIATSMDIASSSQAREEDESGNQDLSPTMHEGDRSSLISSTNQTDDIELTKLKLVSSWKVNSRKSF